MNDDSRSPVASYPRGTSPACATDVAGNVWEWTASPYCPYDAPDCGDTRRVLRGGGWNTVDAKDLRVTRRRAGSPTERSHSIGFRCAWPR